MAESPSQKSRRLERWAREAVDALHEDRSGDTSNIVDQALAEDARLFALNLVSLVARAERWRGRPVPDRESLLWLRWKLLGFSAWAAALATSLLLSWWRPDAMFAWDGDWFDRSVAAAGVIIASRYVVISARLLRGAGGVLTRLEEGKPHPVSAVVGDPKGLGTVLEVLDGTSRWIELRADIGKPQRYTQGQEVAVYGPLRPGAVVAVSSASRVHWARVKRVDVVRSASATPPTRPRRSRRPDARRPRSAARTGRRSR